MEGPGNGAFSFSIPPLPPMNEEAEEGGIPQENRVLLVGLLALATLVFFGIGGAWLIVDVQERDLLLVIMGAEDPWLQMLIGVASGLIIAYAGWALIARPFMEPVLMKYAALIGPLMPGTLVRLIVSICAGVGEELFFRGAIQFWLGIPLTAVIFVALHGYLDPRSWRLSLYGIFLTIAMMGIGWQARTYGLLAPMIAHTVIDVVLLAKLVAVWRRSANA